MNPELLKVAVELLHERGWEALNLDTIAARAGVSRATVWRHGITRASVEKVLRHRLITDYRELLWGPLTASGSGQERLRAALLALCEVAERNLPLLAHTETAFHGPDLDAVGIYLDFFAPWLRIMEYGFEHIDDHRQFVMILTNAVLLTYVHLRSYHDDSGWQPANTADFVVKLVSEGYLPRASHPQPGGYPQAVGD